MLACITGYYIWNLPFEIWHRYSICFAICMANINICSIFNQYICGQLYLSSRIQNINSILSQLIFDQPISSDLLLIDDKPTGKLLQSIKTNTDEKHVARNAFERSVKSDVSIINSIGDRVKYPINTEFPWHVSETSETRRCKVTRFKTIFVMIQKT